MVEPVGKEVTGLVGNGAGLFRYLCRDARFLVCDGGSVISGGGSPHGGLRCLRGVNSGYCSGLRGLGSIFSRRCSNHSLRGRQVGCFRNGLLFLNGGDSGGSARGGGSPKVRLFRCHGA